MEFEPYFQVRNLVSVHLKSIILGQMINMIFHVVLSVYRLAKISMGSKSGSLTFQKSLSFDYGFDYEHCHVKRRGLCARA